MTTSTRVLLFALLILSAAAAIGAVDGEALRNQFMSAGGLYDSSPSTLSDGERDELRLTSAGLLRVSVEGGTGGSTDTELAAAAALADNAANATTPTVGAALLGFDGTTWDRVANGNGTAAAALRVSLASDSTGALIANGSVAHDGADSGNPVKIGAIGRATWEATASTAGDRVNLSADLQGRARVIVGQEKTSWSVLHTPAANNQATISKAAAASTKHVAKGYAWSLSSGAGAPTPELITIAIRDGATGAGTIIWEETVSLPATAGISARGGMTGLYLVGTANTAMTIETDSAPGANVVASVSLFGESIND